MDSRAYTYRIVAGAGVTLGYSEVDQYGDPAPATLAPTVDITRVSDGATIPATINAPRSSDAQQIYDAVIDASDNNSVDEWVIRWTSGDSGNVRTETATIVGSAMFTLADADATGRRVADDLGADRKRWARTNAEHEAMVITGRSFVPTFRRDDVFIEHTTNELMLDGFPLIELAAINDVDTDGVTLTPWTTAELAATHLNADAGILRLTDDLFGRGRYRVDYRLGYLTPPPDVVEAAIRRYFHYLTKPTSGMADRALSYRSEGGDVFRLSVPSRGRTGDPEVDAIYARYTVPEFAR